MKIKIKYQFSNKFFYYIVPEQAKMLKNIERKNKKHKKVIDRCLKRYLPKKISDISKLLNVSEWNISCKVISGLINDNYLQIVMQSSDGRVFGDLNMEIKSLHDDELDNDEDSKLNPLSIMTSWLNSEKINSKKQLTLDKIKNNDIDLLLNTRLMEDSNLYKSSEFSNIKEIQDDILEYLKQFDINIMFNHFILVKKDGIKWSPRYIKLNKDDDIKIAILYDILNRSTKKISDFYPINNISNNIILKSFIEQKILNVDNIEEKEVTKEEIKEYFDIDKMCSY